MSRLKFFIFLTGIVLLSVRTLVAANTLSQRVDTLVASHEKKAGATVSLCVLDLRTGQKVAAVRENMPRTPASNQKILTSAFALCRLGGQFHFTTTVYLKGDDLIVTGDFDPLAGDPNCLDATKKNIYSELDRWAKIIKQKNGSLLRGDILVRSNMADQFRHNDWPKKQHHRWYSAPVAELNFHNNCFNTSFRRSSSRISADVKPQSYLIRIINRVKPGRRHLWSLRTNEDDSQLTLRGTVKTSTSEALPTAANNPPLLFGRVLADRLVRAGVNFSGKVRIVKPDKVNLAKAKKLAQTTTPLSAALIRANKRSMNMVAECIFLRAGDGTWAGSARLMAGTLKKEFGLKPGSLTICDGGGLCRKNKVSSAAMARILASLCKRKDARVFLKSLPIGGIDGTLKKRFTRRSCRGRIRAKTGYIAGASCLSGYVTNKAKKTVFAFSIMANRSRQGKPFRAWQAKKLQNAICRLLVENVDKKK